MAVLMVALKAGLRVDMTVVQMVETMVAAMPVMLVVWRAVG